MDKENSDKIRIVDIARLAGVSTGTVDRVIHNRGRVSDKRRVKVEKVLSSVGYEPNMAARSLASKKDFSIAVLAPSYSAGSYWELVYKGMERAAAEMKSFGFRVAYLKFDQYDRESFDNAAAAVLSGGYSGVLIATHFLARVTELSAELDKAEIPYVYIDSDIDGCGNLAYFGGDSLVSGRIAGRLLMTGEGKCDRIFMAHIKFASKDISMQMKSRSEGFAEYLSSSGYTGPVEQLELDPDDNGRSAKALNDYLRTHKGGKTGGMVLNSRIYQLVGMLDLIGDDLKTDLKLVGFEAIPANVDALMKGKVASLVSQRPELQGYNALKALGDYFLYGKAPEKENLLPLDILIKENAPYYLNF